MKQRRRSGVTPPPVEGSTKNKTFKDLQPKSNQVPVGTTGAGVNGAKFKRNTKNVGEIDRMKAYKEWVSSNRRYELLKENFTAKLSKPFIAEYCNALLRGHFPEMAARALGVTGTRIGKWLDKGRQDFERLCALDEKGVQIRPKDISLEHQFYVNVEMATFQAEDEMMKMINTAMESGNFEAVKWKMERRHHERWGRKDKDALNLNLQTNVQHVIMAPDQAPSIESWMKQRNLDAPRQ